MIIKKETLQYFANKGISVRYYPENTFEEFEKRVYNDSVESYINYYKDTVSGCEDVGNGYSTLLFKSKEELREKAIEHANSSVLKYKRGLDPYDYNTLYIEYTGRTIVKKINQKSKLIDIDYINREIEKSKKLYAGVYGKFTDKINTLLKNNNIGRNLIIYPTSYGIGVVYIYNCEAQQDIKLVTDILERNNIEYYNEFSDARWVYRFKISKKQANIKKLK